MSDIIEQLAAVHYKFRDLLPPRNLTPEDIQLVAEEILKYKDYTDPNFHRTVLIATQGAKSIPSIGTARDVLRALETELLSSARKGRARDARGEEDAHG